MGGAWQRTEVGGSSVVQRGELPELLLVTAVLTSSATLGSVAETFGVHETSHYDSAIVLVVVPEHPWADLQLGTTVSLAAHAVAAHAVADAAHASHAVADAAHAAVSPIAAPVISALSVPDAPPIPFIGPVAEPHQLVQGTRFLQQLALLPLDQVSGYVAAHPDVVAGLLTSPPPPTEVTNWWSTLAPPMQRELRSVSPSLVGNLDGIPFAVRDTANRALLTQTMAKLRTTIAGESGRTIVENAKVQLKMLQSISDALGGASASPDRTLMTLDVTGQGKAAIVVGDLSTATYVSYLVPGMFFTIENQMGDWADAAANLYDEELSWLALLDPRAADKSVATVAWIGYHTPNLTNVGGIQNADEGRDSLAHAIEGLQALRKGNEPYTTIIAHSYGSTAALMALTEYDFSVDALALVGSPGSPAKSASELHVHPGNVWVGEAAWDPIPNSSYFGSDPGSKSYGAKRMGVGGGLDALTSQVLLASTGHNEYFSAGTESMRNFALISIDQGKYVSGGN